MQFENQPQENIEFDDDGFIVDYSEEDDYVPTNNVVSIDEVLQRRTSVRLNRNRVVTLRDLIRQLEFYEKLEHKQSLQSAHAVFNLIPDLRLTTLLILRMRNTLKTAF